MNRRYLASLGILFGILLWGTNARSNRIHYESMTLAELVAESTVVVVARPAAPATVTKAIPIGKQTNGKPSPAFVRVKSRYVVEEVLKADQPIKRGQILAVDQSDFQSRLMVHRMYYEEGISKSPIYRRYNRAKPIPEGTGKVILFLQRDPDLEFVAEGARETLDKLDRIKRLLAKSK